MSALFPPTADAPTGPSRPFPARMVLALAFLLVMGTAILSASRNQTESFRIGSAATPAAGAVSDRPDYQIGFAPDTPASYIHSSTALETRDGRLLVAWYAGTQEGTRDTLIHSAALDLKTGQWGPRRVLLSRQQLAAGTHRRVKKLGNPVLARLPDGRLGLFVVSTAAFGWAASHINVAVSEDEGVSFSTFRHLQLSPWFNISTLVRAPASSYANGDLLLPVYHEFMGKFGEVLRIDENLEIRAKKRLTWGRDTLQPAVAVPAQGNGAVAFLRSARRNVHRMTIVHRDPSTGLWGDPIVTSMPNPNSGLDVLRVPDGSILMAFNDDPVHRMNMTIARSRDNGSTWERLALVEEGGPKSKDVSYPTLVRTSNGDYHLFYSWRNQRIRHLRFNQAWLDAQS